MSDLPDNNDNGGRKVSRRKLLGRLGLAAGAVYMAPVMLSLSQAHASSGSAPSRPSRPSSPSAPSAPSRPSAPSAPSRPSRPSAPSAPSRPSRPSRPTSTRPPRPNRPSRPSLPSRLTYQDAIRLGQPQNMTWEQWQAWLRTLPR